MSDQHWLSIDPDRGAFTVRDAAGRAHVFTRTREVPYRGAAGIHGTVGAGGLRLFEPVLWPGVPGAALPRALVLAADGMREAGDREAWEWVRAAGLRRVGEVG